MSDRDTRLTFTTESATTLPGGPDAPSLKPPTVRRSWPALSLFLLLGLAVRVLAAIAAELYARQKHVLDLFGDSLVYWHLAGTLRTGTPFLVEQWGIPHLALRTPGYPAFLALCQILFGPDATLAPRLVQAGLGAISVWLVFRLVASVLGPRDRGGFCSWFVPLSAAAIVALEPYTVGMSALLLSEALFIPLMLLNLWGMSVLWRSGPPGTLGPHARFASFLKAVLLAAITGAVAALAVLVRPSWLLAVPFLALGWLVLDRSRRTFVLSIVLVTAFCAVMAPWWVRNARVLDRFVPTALWVGASLYDGLSPTATGASDMRFLEDADVRVLGEVDQDRVLRDRAVQFAIDHPERVLQLAGIKALRFWSPWPNADELSSPTVSWISALATLPLFALTALGIWNRRRDPRALLLLAGPLLYFFLLHLVFVSSIRYRIPGLIPAMGLAAVGLACVFRRDPNGVVCLSSDRPGSRPPCPETRKMILWLLVMPATIAAGGGWYAYTYVTDSTTLTDLIGDEAKRFLPGSTIDIRRGRIRPMVGELTLTQVRVDQSLETMSQPTAEVGWLQIRCDLWSLLRGEHRINQVVLAQPILRLARREDGRWNLDGFLADPWPAPPLATMPKVFIQNGTLLLNEADGFSAILRDVSMSFEPVAATSQTLRFEGTASGSGFTRMKIHGTFHPPSKRLEIVGGEILGLELSSQLWNRLPSEWRSSIDRLGISGGFADISITSLHADPASPTPIQYDLGIRLHGGSCNSPELPFPLNDIELVARVDNDRIQIDRFEGANGRTIIRAGGQLSGSDPINGPLDLILEVTDLELDDRLQQRTPAAYRDTWEQFKPRGRLDLFARILREHPGAVPGFGVTVDFRDVALNCREWPYPLEHVRGRLIWEKGNLQIEHLETLIGNEPAVCWGTVQQPGPNARVALNFEFGSLPVDDTLYRSLPGDMVTVIRQFQPSGRVRVRQGKLDRYPPDAQNPEGRAQLTATLVLGEPFSFTWEGLPYPITDVTGELELGPGRWELRNLKGFNGLAEIEGDGWVQTDGGSLDRFDAELRLRARNLPFNEQLKRSLPAEWRATWEILNPSGSTSLDATIRVDKNEQHYLLSLVPDPQSQIELKFVPLPSHPGATAPPPLELPAMELDRGTFVYDDGVVRMTDVGFRFRGSPVTFQSGTVVIEDSGRFDVGVEDLRVLNFRLDRDLRQLMPPVMAEFARRLEEMPPLPRIHGDLRVGWSGEPDQPAWVSWKDGLVVFNGQNIRTGVPLQSLQGRLDGVDLQFNGRNLSVNGTLDLESVHILGQQITQVSTPLHISSDVARFDAIEGELLGGKLTGQVTVGLAATPQYSAKLAIEDAELSQFTRSIPGPQDMDGRLSGQIAINGLGTDLRTAKGLGDFKIREGDLGELPVMLRLFKFLNTAPPTKTAFDAAEVSVRIEDGLAFLDPIVLTGDAISLRGAGTMDLLGELNLRLRILYGRDRWDIPLLSDAMSQASSQIFDLKVTGPVSFPRFQSEVLPRASELFRSFGSRAFRPRDPDRAAATALDRFWRLGPRNPPRTSPPATASSVPPVPSVRR